MSLFKRNLPFILVVIAAIFFVYNLVTPLSSKKKIKTPYLYNNQKTCAVSTYRPIVIILSSYESAKYWKKTLDSISEQDYPNFRVIYADPSKSALENQYRAIQDSRDDEILVFLDGDGWLAHDRVLQLINFAYEDPNVWMTYGSYVFYPNYKTGPDREISEDVHKKHAYRHSFEKSFIIPPLGTGYAAVFKKIQLTDLQDENGFFGYTANRALMLPAIEMTKKHAKYIKDILYIYNRDKLVSDDPVDLSLQKKQREYIQSLPSYKPINHWKLL